MSQPPSVSFLCTAYRTEDTVSQTIESVLAQTREDWELVVVDNGPSEEMARIVGGYTHDPRIRLLRQENAFAAGGVNAAGAAARGRYVAVLHSDDLVVPEYLERMLGHLEQHPDVGALSCGALYLAGSGVRKPTWRDPVPARYRQGLPVTLRELIEGWLPYYTALVRREVWEEVGGFRRDVRNAEDLAFWCDLLVAGHVLKVLEEPLAVYREDENSDSHGAPGAVVMEESKERVLTAAVDRIGSPEDRAALQDAMVGSRHRRAVLRARILLLEGDTEGARAAAIEAAGYRSDPRTRVMVAALRTSPRGLWLVYRTWKALRRRWRALTIRGGVPTS